MSVDKSGEKSAVRGQPFKAGRDSRRGRGPKKGEPHAGRPPDWLKARMAGGRALCVAHLINLASKDPPGLDPDQMLKLVKDWAPPDEAGTGAASISVSPGGKVTITVGG